MMRTIEKLGIPPYSCNHFRTHYASIQTLTLGLLIAKREASYSVGEGSRQAAGFHNFLLTGHSDIGISASSSSSPFQTQKISNTKPAKFSVSSCYWFMILVHSAFKSLSLAISSLNYGSPPSTDGCLFKRRQPASMSKVLSSVRVCIKVSTLIRLTARRVLPCELFLQCAKSSGSQRRSTRTETCLYSNRCLTLTTAGFCTSVITLPFGLWRTL